MKTGRILSTIKHNRDNLHLLHEAVEGLVFALEAVAEVLDGAVKKALSKPLENARDALERVKMDTDELESLMKETLRRDKPEP